MFRYLLVTIIIIAAIDTSNPLTAQNASCPGSSSCEGSGVLCAARTINGFTCTNSVGPNNSFPRPSLCNGVGVPTNLSWWAFIGSGGPLEITFNYDIGNCEGDIGMQAGIFEENCAGTDIWACNADCNTTTFTLSGNTESCEVYYLWVDGCQGDVCAYTITTSGHDGPPVFQRPSPPPHINGEACVCNTTEVCYMGQMGACEPIIQWFVDGSPVGQMGDQCIDYTFHSQIPVEICYVLTVGDPTRPEFICDQTERCTTVTPLPVIQQAGSLLEVCEKVQPFVWNGMTITQDCINPPCSVRVQKPDGCCVDSFRPIRLIPAEVHIGGLWEVPFNQQPFTWLGVNINASCINPPCTVRVSEHPDSCAIDSVRPIRLLLPDSMAFIKGKVFTDHDMDCLPDNMDASVEGIEINIVSLNNTFQTITDSNGMYAVQVPFGEYEVSAFDPSSLIQACPDTADLQIEVQDSSYCRDFYLRTNPDCYPALLTIKALGGFNRLRCDSRTRTIKIQVTNSGTLALKSDTIVFEIDQLYTLVDANQPYRLVNDKKLHLFVPPLLPGQTVIIQIHFDSECGINNDRDLVCFSAQYQDKLDCNGELIRDDYCSRITQSYDPNDLTVNPFGFLDQRYIDRTQVLTGIIRFHNTGSDTAYDVQINLDFPKEKIDPSSIKYLGSSFGGTDMSVADGHLHFELTNIYLPHDEVDSINSHGYVMYSIGPANGIEDWQVISQQAQIYFDFNAPIATNIEFHTIAGNYIQRNEEVVACVGDTLFGSVINGDTTLRDTSFQNGPDIITEYLVTALPSYRFEQDTLILAGDEIRGVRIYRDTTIQFNYTTVNGCDSLYIYHVEATTTRTSDAFDSFSLFPNPVQGGMIHFSEVVRNTAELKLIDENGRQLILPIRQGKRVDVSQLKSGIYIYRLRLDDDRIVTGKLMVQ